MGVTVVGRAGGDKLGRAARRVPRGRLSRSVRARSFLIHARGARTPRVPRWR